MNGICAVECTPAGKSR